MFPPNVADLESLYFTLPNSFVQNWSHVTSYVNKATATPTPDEGPSRGGSGGGNSEHNNMMMRLNCCAGLADMANRQYKAAAKKFISANLDHCDLTDIMSTQNIATYGGLCALATLDRVDLHKQVIASSSFKLFLELDPQVPKVGNFPLQFSPMKNSHFVAPRSHRQFPWIKIRQVFVAS